MAPHSGPSRPSMAPARGLDFPSGRAGKPTVPSICMLRPRRTDPRARRRGMIASATGGSMRHTDDGILQMHLYIQRCLEIQLSLLFVNDYCVSTAGTEMHRLDKIGDKRHDRLKVHNQKTVRYVYHTPT